MDRRRPSQRSPAGLVPLWPNWRLDYRSERGGRFDVPRAQERKMVTSGQGTGPDRGGHFRTSAGVGADTNLPQLGKRLGGLNRTKVDSSGRRWTVPDIRPGGVRPAGHVDREPGQGCPPHALAPRGMIQGGVPSWFGLSP